MDKSGLSLVPCVTNIRLMLFRSKIRKQYKLDGAYYRDMLVAFFCYSCALIQINAQITEVH